MAIVFESNRLIVRNAKQEEINWIMALERKACNKNFVFQGSYEDHLKEINDPLTYLCITENKKNNKKYGYFIACHDPKNNIFEFKRFVMTVKNQGFGSEVTKALMVYAFEILKVNRFWLDVFTYNKAGIHLYEKLGLQRDGIIREGYKDGQVYKSYYIYSILKDEYEAMN